MNNSGETFRYVPPLLSHRCLSAVSFDAYEEPMSFGAFMAIYRTEYYPYIVHYLRSAFFRSVFDDGNSTTINQLTQDMLKRAVVPFPPLAEQPRIVAAIEAALYELNRIEKSLS